MTATFAFELPVSSSNSSPFDAPQLRILNHTAVVPVTPVFQFASSEATCVERDDRTGATQRIVLISPDWSAARSSQVIDCLEPWPPAAPPVDTEPFITWSEFVPRFWKTSFTAACA